MLPRTRESSEPLNTCAVGPVIQTPSSRQSTSSSPPSRWTATCRSTRPKRAAATAAALEPDPDAGVTPAPRSQILSRIACRDMIETNSTFVRSGNIGCRSNFGPSSSISTSAAFGTMNTQCGFPMLSAEGAPPIGSERVSASSAKGMSCQSKRGCPMFTPVNPPPASVHANDPWSVSIETAVFPDSSNNSLATHRVALPQAPDLEPSALKNTSLTSQFSESRSSASWSNPTPRRRSANPITDWLLIEPGIPRKSTTMKSFPRPCIFMKRRSLMPIFLQRFP